jgi:hypothetical protein
VSKVPGVGDSVTWLNLHAKKLYKHNGVVEEMFERNNKVMASVRTVVGRRKIVPAGRLELSSRIHNVKGKELQTSNPH